MFCVARAMLLSQIMHGGLFSEDGVTLDDLRKIDRNRQPPDSGGFRLPRAHRYQTGSERLSLELSYISQVPCVTYSGRIHSLRLVTNPLLLVSVLKNWFHFFSRCVAERSVDQQARCELSVRARCDRTLPGTEQARVHCA